MQKSVEKVMHSRTFFASVHILYVIEKEYSSERNPSEVSFVLVTVSLSKSFVFRQTEIIIA